MLRVRFASTVTAFLVCLAVPAAANADPGLLERVSQGPSGGNGAVSVDQGRLSDDGRCVVFDTTEKLTSDDPNDRKDIYERCDSTTVLVSTGPAPNADTKPSPYLEYRGMSSDGGCVLFDTNEVLTNDDGDANIDIYKRCGASIERVSQGPQGGNAPQDVHHGTITPDGVCVVFQAHEALTSDDQDTIPDIYERCGSTVKRISQGPAGGDDPAGYANFENVTPDGACVAFTTREKLTADDSDDSNDLYARCGSTTTKLTPGNGAFDVSFDALSPDGKCAVFETQEQLAATDTDTQYDAYRACGDSVQHLTTGPAGGGGDFSASVAGVSEDTSCVVFDTDELITPDDTDSSVDSYKRCGSSIERVSTGAAGGNAEIDASTQRMSRDGRCVVFTSAEHITADDSDPGEDVFERCGSVTERVSQGPAGGNGSFTPTTIDVSTDGTRVVFTTDERLTADDTNDVTDIYERSNGQTTRVSPDQKSDNPYGSNPQGVSADASRILFSRFDTLTSDDTDDGFDIYLATIAPTAATGEATGVGQTGATLNGTTGGEPAATYHFEYDGSRTPETAVPAGAGLQSVSAVLTGLTPGTTYRYRLVVTSAGGTAAAAQRAFTTAPSGVDGGSDNGSNDGGTGDGGDQSAPPGAPEPFAGVAIVPGKVKVKHGIATVKITCPATAQSVCAGRLTLKGLGAKSFRIAPGKAAKVQVHLTRAGRKLLSAKRTVRTNAIAVSHDARGVSVTTKAKLKLVR